MMTFGSLFAGIGGLDLGLERAGMICKWQVEIDDYATKVLEKHWPDVARFRDVRECYGEGFGPFTNAESGRCERFKLQSKNWQGVGIDRDGSNGGVSYLEPVDLICGGFPCQDVSLAGKRQGLEGKRTTLWSEFARIVGEVKPRWVLAENVPGLYSSDSGRFFGRILRDLAESGYDAEWDCIPAAAVGAPHCRYRVFIVANSTQFDGQFNSTEQRGQGKAGMGSSTQDVAHANRHEQGRLSVEGRQAEGGAIAGGSGEDVADANTKRLEEWQGGIFAGRPRPTIARSDRWTVEPDVGRVAHGIPKRVDRLRCLGNAVVPQVAEWIGRRIMEAQC